jgi:hypothetical protein
VYIFKKFLKKSITNYTFGKRLHFSQQMARCRSHSEYVHAFNYFNTSYDVHMYIYIIGQIE